MNSTFKLRQRGREERELEKRRPARLGRPARGSGSLDAPAHRIFTVHGLDFRTLVSCIIPHSTPPAMRNLYAGQEATVRTGHGTTDWFQIGKAVRQGCILSPCLFNLYAEYIMRNAGLEVILGFLGGTSGKEPTCQCERHKRHRFNPWVHCIAIYLTKK